MRPRVCGVRLTLILSIVASFAVLTMVAALPSGNIAQSQDDNGEQQEREFNANLTGEAEVPPVATNATGEAVLVLNEDGDEIEYELDVQDIEGILAAHIHQGHPTQHGPVLVTLYNASEASGEGNGDLTEGDFTADDFEQAFQGRNMTDLILRIDGERAYVDIHTESQPGGELRGIIQAIQDQTTEENSDDNDDDDNDGSN